MALSSPRALPNPDVILPRLNTGTTLYLGGIWGHVKSGQTWLASDGPRFVISADSMSVVYALNGKIYVQDSRGFAGEVTTYPFVAAGRNAKPWVEIAQVEVKLICGIVAGSSGVGFVVVIGTEIAQFAVENRDNFGKWHRQLSAVLRARAILKQHAPVLYDKVFDAVLHQIYKDVKGHIPESVTPEIVAFGVGVVVGSVGKKLAQGKFSLLAVIFVIVEQLAIRFSLGVLPGAIKITEDEYRRMADQIVSQLKAAGVTIHDADIRKIVDEVRRHPAEIRKAFEEMKGEFEEAKKAAANH